MVFTKIIRLFALNFYEPIVNMGFALVNYHVIKFISFRLISLHWPDLTWPDLTWPDLTRPDLTWPDLTRPDMTWPDQTWPDLAWPDLIWSDLMSNFEKRDLLWSTYPAKTSIQNKHPNFKTTCVIFMIGICNSPTVCSQIIPLGIFVRAICVN